MKQIVINGIPIELEKKRIKNMYLRILPPEGRVHISAPNKMSEEEIRRFILSKIDWIEIQREKMKKRNIPRDSEYISGEVIYLWGYQYTLLLKEGTLRGKVSMDGNNIILSIKEDSTLEQRKKLMDAWYKKAMQQEVPVLLTKWEGIIGEKSSSWNIRDMKTRWGTCNVRTRNICLNLQLAKKPHKCLEYVIVHELVHLLERSHNAVFKGYMDHFLPNWREIKRELNGLE